MKDSFSGNLGWIKLHRKVLDSRVFANPELLKLWTLCLCKANHKNTWVEINGISDPIRVGPGEFITGRYALHRDYYTSQARDRKKPITTWRWLQKLEKWGNLNINSNTKYSLVRINEWDKYQNSDTSEQHNEQQMNNRRTTDDQQMITNKNDNNAKNEKNDNNKPSEHVGKYTIKGSDEWEENQPIDYSSFVDLFNEISNANCRMTDNKRKDIQKQLKHFTGVEIKRALTNRAEILRDSEYLTSWESVFTRKIERMEKYLNANPNKSYDGKRKPSQHGFDREKAKRDLKGLTFD